MGTKVLGVKNSTVTSTVPGTGADTVDVVWIGREDGGAASTATTSNDKWSIFPQASSSYNACPVEGSAVYP
jgi:hypothetical protein